MSECFTYRALLSLAYKYGNTIDEGIELYASIRDLSIYSGLEKYQAISQALQALEDMGLIILISPNLQGYANRIILKEVDYPFNNTPFRVCRFCVPFATPEHLYAKDLNHKQIFVLEVLDRTPMSLDQLTEFLGGNKKDIKRRVFKPLLPYLGEKDGFYSVREDVEDLLDIDHEKLQKKQWRILAERDKYYGTANVLMEIVALRKARKY